MTSAGERMTTTPTGRLLGQWLDGSPEWHAARRGRLGGSEIAAVMGLSPWESRFSLWHRKAEFVGDPPQNSQMSWGKRLEAPIADAYADTHPELTVEYGGTWVHGERSWQLANPDRILSDRHGDRSILEIKAARDDIGWGEPGTDEVPVCYRTQVLWYLATLGLSTAHIAVLIAGSDYREYTVTTEGAEGEVALMVAEAEAFLASIAAGERPDIDGSTATYQVVKQLPEGVDDVDVEIPPDVADAYRDALTAAREADAEKRRATSEVLDLIGTGRRAVCLGERVATRTVRDDGTTRSLMPART